MKYEAFYIKYRPKVFLDVEGQNYIKTILSNSIKFNKIFHALLFSGPKGCGKTTIAKIYAKALNCENKLDDGSPCLKCNNCLDIENNQSFDVIEIDAASNNGVDSIRSLLENVYVSSLMPYKVYIIDEAHMLSTSAFNTLLKTLEEPPLNTIFILATTEKQKILKTISSRCQIFDFSLISNENIKNRLNKIILSEKIKIDDEAIDYIIKRSSGSLRDAIKLLDQIFSYKLDNVIKINDVLEITSSLSINEISNLYALIFQKDIKILNEYLDNLINKGKDPNYIIYDMIEYLKEKIIDSNYNLDGIIIDNKNRSIFIDKLMNIIENLKNSFNIYQYFKISILELSSLLDDSLNSNKIINKKEIIMESYEEDIIEEVVKKVKKQSSKKEKITIKEINYILNNASKSTKDLLKKTIDNIIISKITDPIFQILSTAKIIASSDDIAILTLESIEEIEVLINDENYSTIINTINENCNIKDIYFLMDNTFNEIKDEYLKKYKLDKNVILDDRELIEKKGIIKRKTRKSTKESNIDYLKKIFGDKLIIKEI